LDLAKKSDKKVPFSKVTGRKSFNGELVLKSRCEGFHTKGVIHFIASILFYMYNGVYGQRGLFLFLEREIEGRVSFINMNAVLAMVIYLKPTGESL